MFKNKEKLKKVQTERDRLDTAGTTADTVAAKGAADAAVAAIDTAA